MSAACVVADVHKGLRLHIAAYGVSRLFGSLIRKQEGLRRHSQKGKPAAGPLEGQRIGRSS